MSERHSADHVDTWRREGGVMIPGFFTPEEVAAVLADFRQVFGEAAEAHALAKVPDGGTPRFNPAQFKTLDTVPLDCSPALNLIGVHPALVSFAKAALGADDVHLYQCQAWAKFTGAADYEQPFHCDFVNHTLTVPSEDVTQNCITIICYFTDVSEAHGPMHWAPRPQAARISGPEGTLKTGAAQAELHRSLLPYARSTAGSAGAIFGYSIDIFHRATNLTAPGGVRYAVMACFKRAQDDAIGFTAWPWHHMKPWKHIFDHASPEQLACFGVPRPGHRFWTETTLAATQARYPGWNAAPYRAALTNDRAA